MNRFVGRLHSIIRTHVDRSRSGSRRSRGIAALLNMNATGDLTLARGPNRIEHDVQAVFTFEPGVKLVEQGADSGGQIRHGGNAAHNGERLLGNLLHFHRV
jgi:hypothetical protein